MMSTAFEILLEFPEHYKNGGKSGYFADKLDEKIARNNFRKFCNHSVIGDWGWKFYKLRNKIVHGEEIGGQDLIYLEANDEDAAQNDEPEIKSPISHLMVADAVFCELVYWQLYGGGYLSQLSKGLLEQFGSDRPMNERLTGESIFFEEYHRKLGWIIEQKSSG